MIEERRATDPWRVNVETQIVDLAKKVDDNTLVTVQTKERVDEVHEVLMTIKGALKALGWLGSCAKWCTYILGLGSAIWLVYYQATHDGNVPPPTIDVPK